MSKASRDGSSPGIWEGIDEGLETAEVSPSIVIGKEVDDFGCFPLADREGTVAANVLVGAVAATFGTNFTS